MTAPPHPDRRPAGDRTRLALDIAAIVLMVAGVAAVNIGLWHVLPSAAYAIAAGIQVAAGGLVLGYDRTRQ